jgi:hypothetical protein
MGGLYHYSHAKRVEGLLDAVTDLHCKSLLYLKPAGKALHDPGYLAESGNVDVGDICYMHFSVER